MNRDEQVVEYYLKSLEIGNVLHEPDGKIPPDFSVDTRIGVEVRRLNQHFITDDTAEGLEELFIPFVSAFKEVLESFNSKYQGESYWVSFELNRPFKKRMKNVKKEIYHSLAQFLIDDPPPPITVPVNNEITLLILASNPTPGKMFRFAGGVDKNYGGAVIQMYVDNIRYCLSDKTSKVEPYKSKYAEWWLFLVDYLSWDLNQSEVTIMKSQIEDIGIFKRVCIFSYDGQKLLLDL